MNVCEDQLAFEWIRDGRLPLDPQGASNPAWAGNTVRHLMPDIFESYVKILHRLEANYENIDNPLSPQELSILQIPKCTKLRSFVERAKARPGNSRVRWKEVAEVLDVPFAAGISDEWFRKHLESGCWPRFMFGPDQGFLEKEDHIELARIISEKEIPQICFFRLPEIPFVANDLPLLYEGRVDEADDIPVESGWKAPEYWWPINRQWCVCSDYDLSFTIVGGPRDLISRILDSATLEAIEVSSETRIDYLAPMSLP